MPTIGPEPVAFATPAVDLVMPGYDAGTYVRFTIGQSDLTMRRDMPTGSKWRQIGYRAFDIGTAAETFAVVATPQCADPSTCPRPQRDDALVSYATSAQYAPITDTTWRWSGFADVKRSLDALGGGEALVAEGMIDHRWANQWTVLATATPSFFEPIGALVHAQTCAVVLFGDLGVAAPWKGGTYGSWWDAYPFVPQQARPVAKQFGGYVLYVSPALFVELWRSSGMLGHPPTRLIGFALEQGVVKLVAPTWSPVDAKLLTPVSFHPGIEAKRKFMSSLSNGTGEGTLARAALESLPTGQDSPNPGAVEGAMLGTSHTPTLGLFAFGLHPFVFGLRTKTSSILAIPPIEGRTRIYCTGDLMLRADTHDLGRSLAAFSSSDSRAQSATRAAGAELLGSKRLSCDVLILSGEEPPPDISLWTEWLGVAERGGDPTAVKIGSTTLGALRQRILRSKARRVFARLSATAAEAGGRSHRVRLSGDAAALVVTELDGSIADLPPSTATSPVAVAVLDRELTDPLCVELASRGYVVSAASSASVRSALETHLGELSVYERWLAHFTTGERSQALTPAMIALSAER